METHLSFFSLSLCLYLCIRRLPCRITCPKEFHFFGAKMLWHKCSKLLLSICLDKQLKEGKEARAWMAASSLPPLTRKASHKPPCPAAFTCCLLVAAVTVVSLLLLTSSSSTTTRGNANSKDDARLFSSRAWENSPLTEVDLSARGRDPQQPHGVAVHCSRDVEQPPHDMLILIIPGGS
jgi:hypothetical protein